MRIPIQQQLESAKRLELVSQRLGFAIFQLQSLEHLLASFLVIRVKATKGIGLEVGNQLLQKELKQPLGSTITALKAAGVLESPLADALTAILKDRNWLVHRVRQENRGVAFSEPRTSELVLQIDGITERCNDLIQKMETESRKFTLSQGVDMNQVEQLALEIAAKWEIPI